MYKSHGVFQEISTFMKRQFILIILCLLCFFVIAKTSNAPVPKDMPDPLSSLLACPVEGTVSYALWSLGQNLCMAFLGSAIFYIVISYIPERTRAYKAFIVLKRELRSLYQSMSELIDMYQFETGYSKTNNKKPKKGQGTIGCIEITDSIKKCKCRLMRNGNIGHQISYEYNLYKDTKKCVQSIAKVIENIKGRISFSQLDPALLSVISRLENNNFIHDFIELWNSPFYKESDFKRFIINLDNEFMDLVECHIALEKYNFDQITFEYSKISDEEYKEEKEKQLFWFSRSIFKLTGASKTSCVANEIIALEPTEERLRRSVGVMLEMIAYYDASTEKPSEALYAALKIADYIRRNETDQARNSINVLNCFQIKKRLNTVDTEDIRELERVLSEDKPSRMVSIGASILLDDYKKAHEVFCELTEEEINLLIQLPIYRLWSDPPIPADDDPLPFTVNRQICDLQ